MEAHKKINILFLIDYLYGFGGTERHLYDLASRLNQDSFRSIVCPFRCNEYIVNIFRRAGIHIEPISVKRIYGFSAIKQIPALIQLIRKHRIDIVQTFNIDSDLYGTVIGKLAGTPLIVSSRRDLGVYRKAHHLMLSKLTHRYVNHFIAVCNAVATNMLQREKVARQKVTTIYNGFELANINRANRSRISELVRKFKIGANSFVIGNVSHLRPEKGHEVFFEAIRRVKASIPELRVLAVGGGEKLSDFRDEIRARGLDDVVYLTGYVPNVFNFISLMDLCCLTPLSNEGFSNAILEQMAMGKPIIASDVGGNTEAIVHGESGLIVPPDDADALAQAIMKLYKNPTLRKSLGVNAKIRVETEFSMERMIQRMEEFYFTLFEKNSNGKY